MRRLNKPFWSHRPIPTARLERVWCDESNHPPLRPQGSFVDPTTQEKNMTLIDKQVALAYLVRAWEVVSTQVMDEAWSTCTTTLARGRSQRIGKQQNGGKGYLQQPSRVLALLA
jgi:hypothetical protein